MVLSGYHAVRTGPRKPLRRLVPMDSIALILFTTIACGMFVLAAIVMADRS